jgi:D-alanyl-D-alanine dipeptidase
MGIFCRAIVSVALGVALANTAQSQQAKPLASSDQALVVTTADWSAVDGTLQRYERVQGSRHWKAVGDPVAIVVGKTGLAWGRGVVATDQPGVRLPGDPVKKEGDGKSPAGVFQLSTTFGYADKAPEGWKMPYLALTPTVECVDDPASKFYNRVLDRTTVAPDWNSSEHMREEAEYYRWGAVVDHNVSPAVPGGGSCIFLHIWGGSEHKPGQGTVGCTAMARDELEPVLAWLDPALHPLLVQLTTKQFRRLKKIWQLP